MLKPYSDKDGVQDDKDNCPYVPNADQLNSDNDANGTCSFFYRYIYIYFLIVSLIEVCTIYQLEVDIVNDYHYYENEKLVFQKEKEIVPPPHLC